MNSMGEVHLCTLKNMLKVDWATAQSVNYACKHWHYSKSCGVGKLVKVGAWEDDTFIGVVVFGRGANSLLHKPYGIGKTEICELVRIAMNNHITPISRIVSIALKFLKKVCPDMRVCVSYADPEQGHYGGIYQAGNWIYTGITARDRKLFYKGRWRHPTDIKNVVPAGRRHLLMKKFAAGKYRYVMPLDKKLRPLISAMRKPYPKADEVRPVTRDASSIERGVQLPPIRSNKQGAVSAD